VASWGFFEYRLELAGCNWVAHGVDSAVILAIWGLEQLRDESTVRPPFAPVIKILPLTIAP
jgi:hypothetical protein